MIIIIIYLKIKYLLVRKVHTKIPHIQQVVQINKWKYRQIYGWTDRQINRWMDERIHRQTDEWTNGLMDRQTDGHTKQMDRSKIHKN